MRKKTVEEIRSRASVPLDLKGCQRVPACVVVDNVRSLHNVGAIFRTADGFLLEKIYLCGITGRPPQNKIRKVSLGAEDSVPWEYHKSSLTLVQDLKSQGYELVALEQTDKSASLGETLFKFPLCIIVGHEFRGVTDQVLNLVDRAVEIPMLGLKSSLNVSIAFGIAAYEIIRQYRMQR